MYPHAIKCQHIADELELSKEQVVLWFKNRRRTLKRNLGIATRLRTIISPEQGEAVDDKFQANIYVPESYKTPAHRTCVETIGGAGVQLQ